MIPLGEAHLWAVRLNEIERFWPEWSTVLSPEERVRANRFVKSSDQFRSAASRAVLRRILGDCLGVNPADVSFSYNRYGKPGIIRANDPVPIQFNLSHSHEFALIAVTGGVSVGVDVEWLSRDAQYSDLVGGICSNSERANLDALPETDRLQELYRYWTLKEACVKALGQGLSYPHREVEVMATVSSPGMSRYAIRGREMWSVFTLDDLSGYVASVVAAGPGMSLCRRDMVWLGG